MSAEGIGWESVVRALCRFEAELLVCFTTTSFVLYYRDTLFMYSYVI